MPDAIVLISNAAPAVPSSPPAKADTSAAQTGGDDQFANLTQQAANDDESTARPAAKSGKKKGNAAAVSGDQKKADTQASDASVAEPSGDALTLLAAVVFKLRHGKEETSDQSDNTGQAKSNENEDNVEAAAPVQAATVVDPANANVTIETVPTIAPASPHPAPTLPKDGVKTPVGAEQTSAPPTPPVTLPTAALAHNPLANDDGTLAPPAAHPPAAPAPTGAGSDIDLTTLAKFDEALKAATGAPANASSAPDKHPVATPAHPADALQQNKSADRVAEPAATAPTPASDDTSLKAPTAPLDTGKAGDMPAASSPSRDASSLSVQSHMVAHDAASKSAPIPVVSLKVQSPQGQVHLPTEQIAVAITRQSRQGANRFEIRLDPPELGRIDVRLELRSDGRASASLTVDRADTLDLLTRDARVLQKALSDAGISADQDALRFSLRNDHPGGGRGRFDQPTPDQREDAPAEEPAPSTTITQISASYTSGRLDLRV